MHLEYQGLVRSIAALAAPNAGHVRMAHENITVLIEVMAGTRSEAQRVSDHYAALVEELRLTPRADLLF